jgi:hypothetical protein
MTVETAGLTPTVLHPSDQTISGQQEGLTQEEASAALLELLLTAKSSSTVAAASSEAAQQHSTLWIHMMDP